MPMRSQAQRRLMYAAEADPDVAKKTGVPQSVAREFVASDKPGKLPEKKTKARHRIYDHPRG
jgi:hypothetical protein